jgi:serralysin
MANLKGTTGKDVVTVKSGNTFEGDAGDDEITLESGSTASGDAGNDVFKLAPGVSGNSVTLWYWSSQNAIYVDLEAGFALDGFGGRDTFVGFHQAHGFKTNGDKGFGTATADDFYLGAPWRGTPSLVYLDGRGGIDKATLSLPDTGMNNIVLSLTNAGTKASFYLSSFPNSIYQLDNIEILGFWNNTTQKYVEYDLKALATANPGVQTYLLPGQATWSKSFIDASQLGSEYLLRGAMGWQSASKGTPVSLTFGFMTQKPSTGGEGGTGFTAFDVVQKQIVRDVLTQLQQQIGTTFVESNDSAQIIFGINQQTNTRGYSFLPDAYKGDARAGDVWLDVETAAQMQPGQEGYYVLLHELAHALGLQHPLTTTDNSGAPVLLSSMATASNTIMLDLSANNVGGVWPTWYGGYDLQALRGLYGAKTYSPGNDMYQFNDSTQAKTIVDDAGVDTWDLSKLSLSASVDLRGGKASSIGMDSDGTNQFNNVVISTDTVIENVLGTLYDDVITGNSASNTIMYIGGNDIIDGQDGRDTLYMWTKSTDEKIFRDINTGNWNVEALNNTAGSIEMTNMERIYFADKAWALDMGTNENAGRTAKILGALFGLEGLSYPSFRGIGLYFLDAGYSYEALMGAAVDTRLWVGASKADVAKVLMGNIPGLVLDVNAYSSTTAMAIAAADSDLNKAMINLVGLANTGFDYIILG